MLNYDMIKDNKFFYEEHRSGGEIIFDFETRFSCLKNYLPLYEDFLVKNGFSVARVRLLVGIIFLNMAPLHKYPFDKMLWALARCQLNDSLATVSAEPAQEYRSSSETQHSDS